MQLKQYIKNLELRLSDEQSKRRTAEAKIWDLENGNLRMSVMPRGAQHDDLLSYEKLSKEVAQLETNLEQLRTEKQINEKRVRKFDLLY